MPAITNDAPPMNEAIHDGVNGAARRLDAERDRDVGDPGARPRRRRAARGDRAARRRRRCAPSWPRARCGCATPSGRWADTVRGIGELWKRCERVAWRASWASQTRSSDTGSGRSIVLRRPAPARPQPGAAAGAVRVRRHPLGHDPAAADARLAPRRRDPGRDPLGAEADQGLRALASRPARTRPTWRSTTSAGATSTSTPTSCASGSRRSTRSPRPTRSAPSTCSTPSARARPATATRRPATCRRCGGSSGCCPRRASSTSSATAATSRSRTCG